MRRGKSSDTEARASEYSHSYFDHEGLDLIALSTHAPQMPMLNWRIKVHLNSLIAILWINPNSVNHNQNSPPSIKYMAAGHVTPDFDRSDLESDGDLSEDEEFETQPLQCLMDMCLSPFRF